MFGNSRLVVFFCVSLFCLLSIDKAQSAIPGWKLVVATNSLDDSQRTTVFLFQKAGLRDHFAGEKAPSTNTLFSGFIPHQEASFLKMEGSGYTEEVQLRSKDALVPLKLENLLINLNPYSLNPDNVNPDNNKHWNKQSQHSLLIIPSLNQTLPDNSSAISESPDILVFSFSGTGLDDLYATICDNDAVTLEGSDGHWHLIIRLQHLTRECLISFPETASVTLQSADLNHAVKQISLPIEARPSSSADQTPDSHSQAETSDETVAQDSALVIYLSPATVGQHLYDQHYETIYSTHIWLMSRGEPVRNTELNSRPLVLSEQFKLATPSIQLHPGTSHRSTRTINSDEAIQLSKQLDGYIDILMKHSFKKAVIDLEFSMPAIETTAQLISQLDQIRYAIAFPKKRTVNKKSGSNTKKLNAVYQSILTAMETLLLRTGVMTMDELFKDMIINGEKKTFIEFIADCYSVLPTILLPAGENPTQLRFITGRINGVLSNIIYSVFSDQDSYQLPDRIYHVIARIFRTTISNHWHFVAVDDVYNMFSIAGQNFIRNNDVELMFLLAQHLSEHYDKDTYSNEGADKDEFEDNKLFFTDDLFVSIWNKLTQLMPDQDISVEQLQQFEQQARHVNTDTTGWSEFISSYAKAKQDYIEYYEALLNQRAQENADRLLNELEKEHQQNQQALNEARLARSLMVSKKRVKTVPTRADDTQPGTTEQETDSDSQSLIDASEPEYKLEPWEELYQKGSLKLSNNQFTAARSLFQEALNAQPDLLGEAIIYSAIADTYFVPGEMLLNTVNQAFGQTQLLLNTMRHATQKPVDKKRLNALVEQFIANAKELDEPIKYSAEYHLKSMQCLNAIPAEQLAQNQASTLHAIVKQEGVQLEQIRHMLSGGVDALLETYNLRRDFILNMPSDESQKNRDTDQLSKEAEYKQSLQALKHQLNPDQQAESDYPHSRNRQSANRKPDTLYSTFREALKEAEKTEKHWNLPSYAASEETINLSHYPIREMYRAFHTENPQFSFKKLRKKHQKIVIKPSNIQSLINRLSQLTLDSDDSKPLPYYRLNQFLAPANMAIEDVEADHFCLFNAIYLWLSHHREATSAFPNVHNGQALFLALAPYAIELAASHPQNRELNAIAAAFHVDKPNIQLWGTSDMLYALIAPILQVPVLVLNNAQIEAGLPVTATLIDASGSQQNVDQEDIFNVMTRNTMVLVHNANHWMTVLPVSEYHDPASQLETLPNPSDHLRTPLLPNH